MLHLTIAPAAGAGGTASEVNFGEHWRRAVFRKPPKRFCIGMLHWEKQDHEYHHGMRIIPIIDSDKASVTSFATQEYEIWRTWEDCLWLQEHLEQTYDRLSREKRQRLLAGKGVKKNGVYKQPGAASSFDSLPPGPDPHSVAKHFHQLIPKLSKKGTFFSPGQAVLDQRQNQLQNFVMALYQDDMPTLICDLREDRIVTDFFGYWRRDYDLVVKAEKAAEKKRARTPSETSSRGSFSFSRLAPSTTSLSPSHSDRAPSSPLSSHLRLPLRSGRPSTPDSHSIGSSPRSMGSRLGGRRRSHSNASSSGSSGSSSRSSVGSISTIASLGTAQEVPIIFGHNPNAPDLEALPENREADLCSQPATPTRSRRNVRESWQTTASAATYLDGLDYTLPMDERASRSRLSVNSVASFLTTNSADAVIPITPRRASPDSRSRSDRPVSVSSNMSTQSDEAIDPYITDAFPLPPFVMTPTPPDSRAATPVHSVYSNSVANSSMDRLSLRTARTSPISPSVSTTSLSSFVTAQTTIVPKPTSPPIAGAPLFIKVGHDDSIVLLRAQRSTPLLEIRQRIFDKLVNQEGISLSPSYALALIVSSPGHPSDQVQQMKFISSQRDWELATLTVNGKLNLRVLDTLST